MVSFFTVLDESRIGAILPSRRAPSASSERVWDSSLFLEIRDMRQVPVIPEKIPYGVGNPPDIELLIRDHGQYLNGIDPGSAASRRSLQALHFAKPNLDQPYSARYTLTVRTFKCSKIRRHFGEKLKGGVPFML